MSEQTFFIIQKVTINGEVVDKSLFHAISYIEHANLNGSQLMMELRDELSYFRDEKAIQNGALVVLSIGDPDITGTLFEETFRVIKAPATGGVIKLYAMQTVIAALKVPAANPRFFNDRQPAQIALMLSNAHVEAGRINGLGTYHLDMGETPASLLREVASDHASLCHWARGKLRLIPYVEAFAQKPLLTLEAHNNKAANPIIGFRWLNDDYAARQANTRRYVSFSMTEGVQTTAGDPSVPVEFLPLATPAQLRARLKYVRPVLEVDTPGDGRLMAGAMVRVRINKMSREDVLDESIPTNMLITRVTHHETKDNYMCKLELGVLCE